MPFSPVGHIYKRLSSWFHKRGCSSSNARDHSLTLMAATPPYSAENGTEMAFSWFLWPSVSLFSKKIELSFSGYATALSCVLPVLLRWCCRSCIAQPRKGPFLSIFLGIRGLGYPCYLYAGPGTNSFQHHANLVGLVIHITYIYKTSSFKKLEEAVNNSEAPHHTWNQK